MQRERPDQCAARHSDGGFAKRNAGSKTHAVRTKAPNGRGLFDLSGNVRSGWGLHQSTRSVASDGSKGRPSAAASDNLSSGPRRLMDYCQAPGARCAATKTRHRGLPIASVFAL